jgi:hypothetical protein
MGLQAHEPGAWVETPSGAGTVSATSTMPGAEAPCFFVCFLLTCQLLIRPKRMRTGCPISSAFCAEDVGKHDANLSGRISKYCQGAPSISAIFAEMDGAQCH